MTTYTGRLVGLNGHVAYKPPVRAATTANITLSGEQTIDGVAVVAGDRVLVKDQSTGADNGIWEAAVGAWTRAKDFNGANDVLSGTQVLVRSGTTQAGNVYYISTADPITVGTTALTFAQSAPNGTQPSSAKLTALDALTWAADRIIYLTGTATAAVATATAYGRSLLGVADEAAFKALVNLEPGTDVQAQNANLASLAGLTLAEGDLLYATGPDTLVKLAKGTAGQVLKMNSGATAPEWTTSAGSIVALVKFNGTGTVAITRQSNVSSITDNGTGDYTVNFTSALSTADYVAHLTAGGSSTDDTAFAIVSQSTTALRFRCFNTASTPVDRSIVNVTVVL